MKTITSLSIAIALFSLAQHALGGPPLIPFTRIQSDPVGKRLGTSMIWNHADTEQTTGATVAFRKSISLDQSPGQAVLHLFADARYILWVNGQYVDRGPARFQPNGPEYDSVDLTGKLKAGENLIALLVTGNLSGGKVIRHAPGLTALLEIDGKEAARTDASWKWSTQTRFRKITASWADLRDAEIDARIEDGDWTLPAYADTAWQPAVSIRGDGWGSLTARRIPMLRETPVPYTFEGDVKLPVTLRAGQKLNFNAGRIVQAYPVIELTAEAGAALTLHPFRIRYVAKSGPQTHFTIDSYGVMKGTIAVEKGSVTITGFRLIERLYPFERIGRFQSNDAMLNRLWEICARSCEVLSEDAYVDCADRERVEWMDCDPPAFDVTRTAMAGPAGANGKPVFSDPRLLGEMVRRTALTLQPDGWVVWGNPVGYITGQTTTLNAFVCRALADSAFLAGVIGEKSDGTRFSQAAKALHQIINTVLWDEKTGGYHSSYFLSSYVLGVRRDHPVSARKLLIEPHLGDLTQAEGVVVTEFGPVPVSWKRENGRVNFSITIQPDIQTVLALPDSDDIQIDGASVEGPGPTGHSHSRSACIADLIRPS